MAEPLSAPHRYQFVDLYRTAVILLMLEGHVVRTFLAPYLQEQWLFQYHEILHGLSAPAFLFGAGLTFVISSRKRWQEFHHWGPLLSRRVRRLILILSLGLMLHVPFFSFRKIILDGATADYLQLFQCDVLSCIGIGLLSLHALVFFFRNERHFYAMVVCSILVVCFLSPLMWGLDLHGSLPPALSQLLNGNQGSPFPLFPYVGFLYAGVMVSWEFLLAREKGSERAFMIRLAGLGTLVIILGVIFDALPVRIYPTDNFWYTSPNYFLIRCGALMVIVSGFWFLTRVWTAVPPSVTVLGRESLFIYVLHLVMLYGTALNTDFNLRSMIGEHLMWGSALLIFVIVAVVMFFFAFAWNYLKRQRVGWYRLIQLSIGGGLIYLFFTKDF